MLSITPASLKDLSSFAGPVGLFAYEDGLATSALPNSARKALWKAACDEDFKGKAGETVSVRAHDGNRERRFFITGLGKKKGFSAETLRKAGASLYKATKKRAKSLMVLPTGSAQTIVEGMHMGAYTMVQYTKPCKDTILKDVNVVYGKAGERRKMEAQITLGNVYADAVCWVRDLVNQAPSDKSPEKLTNAAKKELSGGRVSIKVITHKEAAKLGMGSYLGVGRGSAQPPYFLHLVYKPKKKSKKRIGLVGKGVTFDSGGLSLKPPVHMETMKMDMAGAATVLGVFKALPHLNVKAEVHGFTPLTYNMPGPDAVKPGDVLRAMNGKTIEVLNTDAEGRLILADALVYAGKQKLDAIIDLATLTGAAVVALGSSVTAAMANNKKLLNQLLAASKKTDEAMWELPLVKEYKSAIKSKVADIKNIGARGEAGTIAAGLFLQEFVEDKQPWVHLDIAGPAWTDGGNGYCVPGGTGAMTRTLLEYLQSV
jgi:leucyl aminopeptidase